MSFAQRIGRECCQRFRPLFAGGTSGHTDGVYLFVRINILLTVLLSEIINTGCATFLSSDRLTKQ